jgi:gluconate 2-dehydrogenase
MNRPRILVARAIFPEVLERLRQHLEVQDNQDDVPWSPAMLTEQLQDKQGALLTANERVDAQVLAKCPQLKIITNMAVGFNNLDIAALTAAGVQATNTPDVLTETTADFAFALLLATARRVTESERFLRAGQWGRWRYDLFAGSEVHGSTLGIVGMGRIGQAIAQRAVHGFGMRVVYCNRSPLPAATEAQYRAQFMPLPDLLRSADHVMLALPYTPEAHHLVGAEHLALMKTTATLVNIARGGVVDDAALAQALAQRRIAAAGLDVFENEPALHPGLLQVANVVLTPHIASATVRTRRAMADLAADNLLAFFAGRRPLTPINTL